MSINLTVPSQATSQELKPRITVIGVGGAGGNAVNNMIQSELGGVDFVVANTDAQALGLSRADRRIQLGLSTTQGLGSGSRPEVGHASAEEAMEELEQFVDTLIVIPNQNLFRVANEKTTFADAFNMADEVLHSGVRGVTDLMVMPGLINLDFADIRSVMSEMGKAMMGTGEADGERRALDAAEAAISNPLLDDISMKGAKGMLINITGGADMTLFEVDEAANRVRDEVDPEAYIIFGSTFDESLEGSIRVSVVATGINVEAGALPRPRLLSVTERPTQEKAIIPEADVDESFQPVAELEYHESETSVVDIRPSLRLTDEVADVDETKLEHGIQDELEVDSVPGSGGSIADEIPSAMPTTSAEDAFIPPAPADPSGVEVAKEPDPFAAAAMLNGTSDQQAMP